MGNTNQTGTNELGQSAMRGWPLLFHATHSNNVQLSGDRRLARRLETFCNGICFSNRTVAVHERVYLRFVEVSTSWSGVIRFGFTSHDPTTVNKETLPRYACPDLTNKPGYWAKALPERFAQQGNVLVFYVNRGGDVIFGINGEEKGIFFSGIATNFPLWGLVDIYGNTTSVEFLDGRQLNNLVSMSVNSTTSTTPPNMVNAVDLSTSLVSSLSLEPATLTSNLIPNSSQSVSLPAMPTLATLSSSSQVVPLPPVRFHGHLSFVPLPFHDAMGRNVCISADRTIAVRRVDEYCNSYVFTGQPLQLGERVIVQILSIDNAYTGGLAFGMTSCDPALILPSDLPDDSDLLLDRPEYWVVNKDVCANPEVGDELSFSLTEEGEIKYGKNGLQISTLMHVDKTLPMWAFFDVYGNTQKIKILGATTGSLLAEPCSTSSSGNQTGLTVLLPPAIHRSHSTSPSRSSGSDGSAQLLSDATPPPRPPPPRISPSSNVAGPSSTSPMTTTMTQLPLLPPKQPRPLSQNLQHHSIFNASNAAFTQSATTMTRQSPSHPPLPPSQNLMSSSSIFAASSYPSPPFQPAAIFNASRKGLPAPRQRQTGGPVVPTSAFHRPGLSDATKRSAESMDNANNECSVCFEKPTDCVLYMCGHMCMCYECALDIKRKQGSNCPICRQPIKDIIKIYRS